MVAPCRSEAGKQTTTISFQGVKIMNKVVSRALWGAFFVGGLTVLGAGAAHAADTSGEDGVASGNQVGILGELPVTIGGNAISILGDSESSGTSTAAMTDASPAAGSNGTTGEVGIASGNQVIPDIVAPIVASGNAISILGDSSTEGTSTGTMPTEGTTNGTTAGTTGEDGIAGGNQVMPDANLPITIGGNSISLIGDTSTEGTSTGTMPTEGTTNGTTASTTGEDGIAGGNQVAPDVNAPVTVTGNDVSVIRDDVLGDGLLDGGLLDDGLLDDGLLDGPLVQIGIIDGVLPSPVVGDSMDLISEPVITAPVVDGPLLGDVDLDVLAPLAVDGTDGTDGTDGADGTPGADGTDGVMAPLMVTAAITPAMMLAATGAEALPLIGGILLMLGTGLGMVAFKRFARLDG
jgi:hypothetical protein